MPDISPDDLQFYLELIDSTLLKYRSSIQEISKSIDNLLSFNKQIYEVLLGHNDVKAELDKIISEKNIQEHNA